MDFRTMLADDLRKITGIEAITRDYIEVPPDSSLGDFSMPCFRMAKELRKAPPMIANDIKSSYDACDSKPAYIDSVEAVNGYLNIRISKSVFVKDVIDEVIHTDKDAKRGETVVLDYSSPNIAKPFHIGHLCSTIIGDSLSKIYTALGYDTVRINYLGDYGTQFGKLISAYKRWGDETALNDDPIKELFRIYVKFHDEAEKNPDIEAEGRMYFKRLEDGEAEELALWERFKALSLKKFNEIYARLDVTFDSFNGESFYSDKMEPVVQEIADKGLLVDSEGAKVIDLSEYNMPPCIILKSDGATIYATRDITAAKWRHDNYNFVKCLYVVGLPQALHFAQVFKSLELMGHEWSSGCEHVGFAHVKFADGKMSTRTGHVVLLEEVLDEAVSRVREKMNTDYIDADKVAATAEKVGIGAIKYAFLKSGRERDILFDWDETLDFNGESGPYVQYSYARSKSILKRASGYANVEFDGIGDEEFELTKLLNRYHDILVDAAERNEPSVIAKYAYTVAKAFNKFYNACQVIGSEHEGRLLLLVEASGLTIKRCLNLLGIDAPEQM